MKSSTSKGLKKIGSKRKQNGKKGLKSHMSDVKPKHETEVSSKDQITELEKEIFSIKIFEMEGKLTRRKQLCSFIAEEKNLYCTLYEQKKLTKKESMKLLNEVHEEFSTEIILLENELDAMEYAYDQLLQVKEFCVHSKERVRKLTELELKQEEKLVEAEKSISEIVVLSSKLSQLQEENLKTDETFTKQISDLNMQFKTFIDSLVKELSYVVENVIGNKSLKLELLPLPYQALFLSGIVGNSWLKSTVNHCESILLQNTEIEKYLREFSNEKKHMRTNMKDFSFEVCMAALKEEYVDSLKESLKLSHAVDIPQLAEDVTDFLHLKHLCMYNENKVKKLRSEVKKLEKEIKLQEAPDEKHLQNSYLMQIISAAATIIRQEI